LFKLFSISVGKLFYKDNEPVVKFDHLIDMILPIYNPALVPIPISIGTIGTDADEIRSHKKPQPFRL
jgi:hypothetical protein